MKQHVFVILTNLIVYLLVSQVWASPPLDCCSFKKTGNKGYDSAVRRYCNEEKPKIVPGDEAEEGEYPWQVSLGASCIPDAFQAHFCGGAIINKNWIRTAAHCVWGLTENKVKVVAGTNKLDEMKTPAIRVAVEKIILEKRYSPSSLPKFEHDIAWLKLSSPLSLNEKIKPVKPAPKDYKLEEDMKLWVSGWGATAVYGGPNVKELRHVDVLYKDNNLCSDDMARGNNVTEYMLCAGASFRDSCKGDSGGALVDLKDRKNPIQVGVVSWGLGGCGLPGQYGVYTDMRRYTEWENRKISTYVDDPNTE